MFCKADCVCQWKGLNQAVLVPGCTEAGWGMSRSDKQVHPHSFLFTTTRKTITANLRTYMKEELLSRPKYLTLQYYHHYILLDHNNLESYQLIEINVKVPILTILLKPTNQPLLRGDAIQWAHTDSTQTTKKGQNGLNKWRHRVKPESCGLLAPTSTLSTTSTSTSPQLVGRSNFIPNKPMLCQIFQKIYILSN